MNSEDLWTRASKTLINENGFCVSDMPIHAHLKEIFIEAVEPHQLSLESSVSFMYGLYYFGQLSMIDMLRLDDQTPFTFDFSSLDCVLLAQKRWAKKANDYQRLMTVYEPLMNVTDKLIRRFSNR